MMGPEHARVGAGWGFLVAALTKPWWAFAATIELIHPLAWLGALPFAPAVLTAWVMPWELAVGLGVLVSVSVSAGFAAFVALWPDVDSPTATLGRSFPDSLRRLLLMHHRGWTHWVMAGLAAAALVWLCCSAVAGGRSPQMLFVYLALAGYVGGHILMDVPTEEAIALFAPLLRWRVCLRLFEADSRTARLVSYGMAAILVGAGVAHALAHANGTAGVLG